MCIYSNWLIPACAAVLLSCAACKVSPSATTAPSSQPASEELQLKAHLVRRRVEPAHPVIIQLTIRNVSKHEVKYMQAAIPEYNFLFTVKSESGESMPLTLYGIRAKHARSLSPGPQLLWPLKPGQEKTYAILINRLYDMSLPGRYKIKATFTEPIPNGHVASVPPVWVTVSD